MKIASMVYADNYKKGLRVKYTDGTVGFFGFNILDIEEDKMEKLTPQKQAIRTLKIKAILEVMLTKYKKAEIIDVLNKI